MRKILNNKSKVTYEQFIEALEIINKYKTQLEDNLTDVENKIGPISTFAKYSGESLIYEVDMSVRLFNTLKRHETSSGIAINEETKLIDLNGLSIKELLKCRDCGKKTIEELKEICFYSGVKLSE